MNGANAGEVWVMRGTGLEVRVISVTSKTGVVRYRYEGSESVFTHTVAKFKILFEFKRKGHHPTQKE